VLRGEHRRRERPGVGGPGRRRRRASPVLGYAPGMPTLRVTYADAAALHGALDQEIARGVLLVKGAPADGLAFRTPVSLEVSAPGGALVVETDALNVLPGVGVVVAFPASRIAELRALAGTAEVAAPPGAEEAAPPPAAGAAAAEPSPAPRAATTAEKIQLALHGTREDRAAILRDQNRTLHAFVLKSPQVTLEEITAWAKNPQMNADFLKQIGDRKEWLQKAAVAQGLARNPRTPPEVALRALDHVGPEALRQMAKGVGVGPHIVQAARRKVITK
jgi:hypothetical protein